LDPEEDARRQTEAASEKSYKRLVEAWFSQGSHEATQLILVGNAERFGINELP
jgi:hypothetical protein